MPRPSLSRPARVIVLGATLGILGTLAGCTDSSTQSPEAPKTGEPATAAAPAEVTPAPPADESAAPPAPREVAPALKELSEKLQPPQATATAPAEAAETRRQAYTTEIEQLVTGLVKAIDAGDGEALGKLLLTSDELQTAVKPGVRPILAGSLLSTNDGVLKQLLERLKGAELRHSWSPGDLVLTPPKSIYEPTVQALGKGSVHVTTRDAVELVIRLDQLIRLEAGWRLLQVSVP